MNKFVKKVVTGVMTVATVISMSSITALAATPSYVNSVGSATEDIKIVVRCLCQNGLKQSYCQQ